MAIDALHTSLSTGAAAMFNSARRAADPFAQALNSASATAGSTSAKGDEAARTAQARESANLALSEFKRTLKQLLASAGIDTSQSIRLEPDGNGGVTVVGHHPDHDKIEQLFQDNPDLAVKFQALAQRFTELRSAETALKPDRPLVEPVFGLSITNDDIDVAFQ